MPRAFDHIVIPAHDLEAEAELYERLGFQVGPRNRHPWGTENHIVQFDGVFLELISLGPDFASPELAPKEYSFAGFVESYLRQREGLGMLVLKSNNAEADRGLFAKLGIGDFSRFDFARQGRLPNGDPVNVAFSLAFAHSSAWDQTGFFVCQQHYPENFWNRRAQFHPNDALGLAAVRLEHPRPEAGLEFLRLFLDAQPRVAAGGYNFELDAGRVETRLGASAAFSGLVFRVSDLATCRRALQAGGVAYEERDARLVVAPEAAMGAALSFEAA